MFKLDGLLRVKVWAMMSFCVIGAGLQVQGQVANNDFYVARAGSAFTVPASGVLSNDTGGSLTAALVGEPANGSLTLNTDGSFTYTPTNNFTGVDGFTYQALKGAGTSVVASADIMLVTPGEVFYDNFSRPASGGAIFPWVAEVTPNVVGTWGITNQQIIGTGTITNYALAYYANNNWTNYSVQAQFRFSANNASSAGILGRLNTTSGAHYAAWIYPEQSPEFLASTNGKAQLRLIKYQNWTYPYTLIGNAVPLPGVGINWHAVKLTFQGNNILAFYDGRLVMSVTDDGSIDGTAAYTRGGIGLNSWTLPPAAYAFLVDNVIVTTNNSSVANYDAYAATGNLTLQVAAPGVLANDTGNGPLTAMLAAGPTRGTLTLTNNGGFTYTPGAGFTGTDSFTYQCTDGQTTSSVTTVTLTINNAALANDDAYTAGMNTILRVGSSGILANDQGGNGPLTALLATGPADGRLTLTNNGGFSYTPTNGFVGTDSFTYQCTDGQTTSGVATVTLTVIPGLTANNDLYNLEIGNSLSVAAPGVLLNDVTTNGSLTAILAGSPGHGNFTWGGDGSFSYTPTNNFTGMDGFTYRAGNGSQTSSVATVDIMVTPPGGLFYDNFARPTGSSSILPWVNELGTWGVTNNVFVGTCALNNYGYAYYNNPNWTDYEVQAQIRYSSSNAWGGAIGGRLNAATGAHYSAWVYPENSPWGPQNGFPTGTATLQIIKYETWTIYTAQNLVRLPIVGTNYHNVKLAFQGNNVAAYFDGNLITNLLDNGAFDGQSAFTNGGVSLDLWAASPTAYTMSVSNVAVFPLMFNSSYSTRENTALAVTNPGVLNGATDVYGTNLIAALIAGPTNGILNLSSNGGFTYTPANNFAGTDGFTFQANDKLNHLGTNTATLTVLPGAPTLTVTADNQVRLYGATNPILTASYNGFINGDGTNVLTGAPALSVSATTTNPIGNYTITAGQGTLGSTNYAFQFVNGTLTVNPSTLTVTARNTNKVYGQTITFAGTEFTSSGLVNSDTVGSVALTSVGATATAGVAGSPYAINATNASGSGLANYTISYQPGILTVNPAALTVTAKNTNKAYGQTMTFAGTEFTSSGLVNGDAVGSVALTSVGATATAGVADSPYAINASNATGSGLADYTISYQPGVLTVNPAALTVTAGNTNKIYGQTITFAGTEFTSSNLLNGDTVGSVALTSAGAAATAGVAGSPYPINATNASGSGLANYTIDYQPGILTVIPPALTVTADDQARMFGLANPELTASYAGFVNNENSNVLSGSPALVTSANATSLVGSYPITITQGTLSDANYTLTFVNGTLAVTSAPAPVILSIGLTNQIVTVTWSSIAGVPYGLQFTTDLTGSNWTTISSNLTAPGAVTTQSNGVGTAPFQFYRVLISQGP